MTRFVRILRVIVRELLSTLAAVGYALRAAAAAKPNYAAAVPTRVRLHRYGPRERNTLDVYTPCSSSSSSSSAAAAPRPLVLFVHGGVWVTVRPTAVGLGSAPPQG